MSLAVTALILAAGKSERMGSPKAILPIAGRTLLQRAAAVCRAAGIVDIRVVTGAHRESVAAAARECGVTVIDNPGYEEGQTTSVQAGLRAAPAATAVLLYPVDFVYSRSEDIRALLHAAAAGEGEAWIPISPSGRRGHPVLFSKSVAVEILELPPSRGVNTVMRALGERAIAVPVDNPWIAEDMDTPADAAVAAERLRMPGM